MEVVYDAHKELTPGEGEHLVLRNTARNKKCRKWKPRMVAQPLLPHQEPPNTSPAATPLPSSLRPDHPPSPQHHPTDNVGYLLDNKSLSSSSDVIEFPGRMAFQKTLPPHLRNSRVNHLSPNGFNPNATYPRVSNANALPIRGNPPPKGSWKVPKPAPVGNTSWEPQPQPSHTWSSDVDSAVADAGNGGPKKKNVREGDASKYKLWDWSGDWAPAPVDWESRPGFTTDAQIAQVDSWLDTSEKTLADIRTSIATSDLSLAEHEIAPPYWKPDFDGQRYKFGWENSMQFLQNGPQPVDSGDMEDWEPFWNRYIGENSLAKQLHPIIKGVDPDENEHERLRRETDYGVAHHKGNKIRFTQAQQAARANKRRERAKPTLPNNAFQPGVDLYIRPVSDTDVVEIAEIYNYYVRNSPVAPETDEVTDADILARVQTARTSKLPFFVACKKGEVIKGRRSRQTEDVQLPDTVIGMAYLENYLNTGSIYRKTVNLYFYTHYQYYGKRVAQCLLDALLDLVDPRYHSRTNDRYKRIETHHQGQYRAIQNLVLRVPCSNPTILIWLERWLTRDEWGFKKIGMLDGIAVKNSQNVHEMTFQRRTDAIIENDAIDSW